MTTTGRLLLGQARCSGTVIPVHMTDPAERLAANPTSAESVNSLYGQYN